MHIPKTIRNQLLTQPLIVGSWGAHKWSALDEYSLAFRVNGRKLNGIVVIKLDYGQDLYDISFYSNKSFKDLLIKPKKKFDDIKGIYCDQMIEVIDYLIETDR